ncbi:hypothetical protein [Flavobacterium sp.]|uniref:hypothetical protein n=1 Tax=Flavobacterium sp. TaxID=239 RepID=UPI0025BD2263|nr:hypothetical protein [Flavobacterium sp.]MBA4152745.1 hypothetical protein [Flavobacterium sp.]
MKKKLEADLISIAHRVLKLKGKEDVIQLHQEAQKLYEKLAILRFYEENINVLKEEISAEELEEKLNTVAVAQPIATKEEVTVEPMLVQEAPIEETVQEEPVAEVPTVEEVVSEAVEELTEEEIVPEPETVAAMEEVLEEESKTETIEPLFNPIFELSIEEEEEKTAPKLEQKQILFEDLLGSDYKEPDFVKVNDVPKEVERASEMAFEKAEETFVPEIKAEVFAAKMEHKIASLNDTLIKGINIGLNDRIAFVKHLFAGSNEDFNRVVSQISTYDSFDEAQSFVEDMVKPDYNNWEGKEDYAARFMNLVEKKFA